jgi:hypothetical protein
MARVPVFGPRYNIALTQFVPVVCNEIVDFEEEVLTLHISGCISVAFN